MADRVWTPCGEASVARKSENEVLPLCWLGSRSVHSQPDCWFSLCEELWTAGRVESTWHTQLETTPQCFNILYTHTHAHTPPCTHTCTKPVTGLTAAAADIPADGRCQSTTALSLSCIPVAASEPAPISTCVLFLCIYSFCIQTSHMHNLYVSATPPHPALPYVSAVVLACCHSVSPALASSVSLFRLSFPRYFLASLRCCAFALSCSLMSEWLECFPALRRDNKPICYLPRWPPQQPTCANSQTPSRRMLPIESVSAASKRWEEAHTWQHSATGAVRRLCIREQHIVMKSHKYFPSLSGELFFHISEMYF